MTPSADSYMHCILVGDTIQPPILPEELVGTPAQTSLAFSSHSETNTERVLRTLDEAIEDAKDHFRRQYPKVEDPLFLVYRLDPAASDDLGFTSGAIVEVRDPLSFSSRVLALYKIFRGSVGRRPAAS